MKKIYLKGTHSDKFALVDDEDYEELNKVSWYYTSGYARCKNEDGTFSYMHKLLMNQEGIVDHVNQNKLDNRRENLRLASNIQNGYNRKAYSNRKYKGVTFQKLSSKYRAQIIVNRKYKHLGLFRTEKEAALAYNEAALEYHGEFAYLNEIEGE